MPHEVLTIGSALVDIFITSTDFLLKEEAQQTLLCSVYGDKMEVDAFEVHLGGGGCNTAVGFTRLGFSAAVISELGTDLWSTIITQQLQAESVDTSLVITEKKEQTGGSVILVGPTGGRSVLVYRGAASHLDPQDIPDHVFANTSWVHLSSVSGQLTTLQKVFALITERKIRFSWNPGKAEIRLLVNRELQVRGLKCMAFFVNKEEWEQLLPIHEEITEMATYVVVTDGPHGGRLYEHGSIIQEYDALQVDVVNETGAGDAFATGFVSGLLWGKDARECVLYGKTNAAQVVQHNGATRGLVTKDQLLQLVAR